MLTEGAWRADAEGGDGEVCAGDLPDPATVGGGDSLLQAHGPHRGGEYRLPEAQREDLVKMPTVKPL